MLIQAPTLNGGLSRRRRFTERRERACFERANEVEDLKRMPVDLPGRKMGDPRRGVPAASLGASPETCPERPPVFFLIREQTQAFW